MTREENIRAILESNFAGYKEEVIDIAVKRICELKQEPKTDNRVKPELNGIKTELEQEPKTDTWSIEEVADALERHGLLEQEPEADILDKIREEIEEKVERYCLSRESIYMGQVDWSERLIKESDVLKIIDKYRQEGEE